MPVSRRPAASGHRLRTGTLELGLETRQPEPVPGGRLPREAFLTAADETSGR